ncbi:Capsular polysaccharide export system inner membrane protein KpsE [plant metagenome]|uniref:Capsular polysaccharide export system inner membrane protein KpsE n=1 Tax=plant metagenome TaxID=1297885 RepID=A0A484SF97_9ZZZZ
MKTSDRYLDLLTPRRLALAIVGLPMLLAAMYYTFIAADRYVSESTVVVRQARETTAGATGLMTMLAGINPASTEDTLYLQRYILSMDMLTHLQDKLDLRKHYEQHTLDWPYHLPAHSTQADLLAYYRSRVSAHYDDQVGLLLISVQGFDAAFAQAINHEILKKSEAFVNDISHQIAREQLKFAQQERAAAQQRYEESKQVLVRFQNEHGFLDPLNTGASRSALMANLEGELAQRQAELYALQQSYGPRAAPVQNLNTQITALERQLEKERQRLVAVSGDRDQLNQIASRYESLALQARIAEEAYKMAVAGAESARIEGVRKLKTLAVITQPTQPDEALYPRVAYGLFTLLVGLSMLYGIARFTVATIRDHKD